MLGRNRPADPNTLTPGEIADELGAIKARVAEETARERALKDALIAADVSEAEGERFRATVSPVERTSYDMDWLKRQVSPRALKRHSTTTETTQVRVNARKRLT